MVIEKCIYFDETISIKLHIIQIYLKVSRTFICHDKSKYRPQLKIVCEETIVLWRECVFDKIRSKYDMWRICFCLHAVIRT